MILSYHPIIEMDENRICAGRLPDACDLEAIRRADAVVLSQGCNESLYRMAWDNCPHVFPNLDVRFNFPGKLGQIELFRRLGVRHPQTVVFKSLAEYDEHSIPFKLPWIFKLNWGGQGDGVWSLETRESVRQVLAQLKDWEKSGQKGFLIQQRIETRRRSLRVTVIGDRIVSYWRIQSAEQPFGSGVAQGARIDFDSDPICQHSAHELTRQICRQALIQLAGFDFLFDDHEINGCQIDPYLLEINHFFGRTGLGGSTRFYLLLQEAVNSWLKTLGLRPTFHKQKRGCTAMDS